MSEKKKELTTMEAAFLEYLAGAARGDIRKAMQLAGYSDNISVTQIRRQLKLEIIAVAQDMLAANSVKAAMAMDDILDRPDSLGARNKIAAAKELLDRAGLVKPEGDVKLNIPDGGIIVLPAKGRKIEEDPI